MPCHVTAACLSFIYKTLRRFLSSVLFYFYASLLEKRDVKRDLLRCETARALRCHSGMSSFSTGTLPRLGELMLEVLCRFLVAHSFFHAGRPARQR